VHPGLVLITCKRGVKKGGSRVPTSGLHAINACWFLFLLSAYLVVAGAASFDKKELCRSDTTTMGAKIQAVNIFQTPLSSHYPLPLSNM